MSFLKKKKNKLKYTFKPSSSRILEFELGQNARVRARACTWITPWCAELEHKEEARVASQQEIQAELKQVIPAQDQIVYTPTWNSFTQT
jgi:hypothetical protein